MLNQLAARWPRATFVLVYGGLLSPLLLFLALGVLALFFPDSDG